MSSRQKPEDVVHDIGDKENQCPNIPSPASLDTVKFSDAGCSWFPPRATFVTKPSGVPSNVPGKRPPPDDSSEDENDESQRARRLLTSKLDPSFDHYNPKFYRLRYTSSGKPYAKRTKPYSVWAANTYGYLRKVGSEKPKGGDVVKNDHDIDEDGDGGDDIGLRTVAYPGLVREKKDALAKEMAEKGCYNKSVNDLFRERYYIEMPYCSWCDFRPCMCYV